MSSKTLLILVLIISLTFTGKELWSKFAPPCREPIKYFINSFDHRFGLAQNEFLSALSEAEAVWEEALRGESFSSTRDLFAYEPENGSLAINLVYDYRQEATVELSGIEDEVEEGESAYRTLERRYLTLKSEHTALRGQYEVAVAIFQSHNAAYEANVERWNSGRRNDRAEFEALEAERRALQTEIAALKSLESKLNSLVKEINSLVGRLNALGRELNLNVEAYNTIGAMRGETFTGGIYTRDAEGERIDIYEFENRAKLVRVLAHELGHALGLEHIADKEAIMYEFNQGEAGKLTAADLSALKLHCGVE